MIRNTDKLDEFNKQLARDEQLTLDQKYALLESMLDLARELGVFPPEDPLEGIEVDIRIARVINSV